MVNSTKSPAKCGPPVNLTTSTDGLPVIKAAFSSCTGVDIHHSILVCAFRYCDIEKTRSIRKFVNSEPVLPNSLSLPTGAGPATPSAS